MQKPPIKSAATLLIPLVLLIFYSSIFAAADSVDITQNVSGGAVCGNGTCETGESSSNCAADCPAESTSSPAPGGQKFDIFPPRITDIRTQPSHNSAVIYFKTSEPALSKLFWGQTQEYKEAVIVEAEFKRDHSLILMDLEPEKIYHFRIEAQDAAGNFASASDRTFKTLLPPDTSAPANVTNLRVLSGDNQITLNWQNPMDADFKGIKIQRSPFFYPHDPFDGQTIYDDRGEAFVDNEVQNGDGYYYAVFTYDESGNYSSGAVAFAVSGIVAPPPEILPPEIPPTPEIDELTLRDFDFWQGGKKLFLADDKLLSVRTGLPLTVSIDYEKVPEVLKTIMITFEKSQDKSYAGNDNALPFPFGVEFSEGQALVADALARKKLFSFILRINAEKTRYEATIMPPGGGLLYPMFVTVMDFKNQSRKRLEGGMEVLPAFLAPPQTPFYAELRNWRYLIYIVVILFLMYLLKKVKLKKTDKFSKRIAYEQ